MFKKLNRSQKYDYGTIAIRAKPGKLIDLDKLHESVWATRLSGGTRSGLVKIEVTAVGHVQKQGDEWILQVNGSDAFFVLGEDPEIQHQENSSSPFRRLQAAVSDGTSVKQVSGRLDGWTGRWPAFLAKKPPKPRRILVSDFQERTDGEAE